MIQTLFQKVLNGFTTACYTTLVDEFKERELPSLSDKLELRYYTPYLSLKDIFPLHFHKEVSKQPKHTELDNYVISFSKKARKVLKQKGFYTPYSLKNLTSHQIDNIFRNEKDVGKEIKVYLFDSLYSPEEIESHSTPCPSPFFTAPSVTPKRQHELNWYEYVENMKPIKGEVTEEIVNAVYTAFCHNSHSPSSCNIEEIENEYFEKYWKLDLQLFSSPSSYPRFDIEEYNDHFEIWAHSIYGPVYLSSSPISDEKEGAIKEGKKVFDQTFRGAKAWKGMLLEK